MRLATGIQLTVLAGPNVPVPTPEVLTSALESAQVSLSVASKSGFQATYLLSGRRSIGGTSQSAVASRLLAPFNRYVLMATVGGRPSVLIDGLISDRQVQPGEQPGTAKLTITGEDMSLKMDREERRETHQAQDITSIVTKIIGSYGLEPVVIPPKYIDAPSPVEEIPSQQGTDLAYVERLAENVGHIFYVSPGKVPGTSRGYWGPPAMNKPPQPALSTNMGPHTNVESLDFENDSTRPAKVMANIIDGRTNVEMPVPVLTSMRRALSSNPPWEGGPGEMRTETLDLSGASIVEALARAQGTVDASMDGAVKATGSLDVVRYGRLLQPNGLVGVRGAGHGFDGLYFVDAVTHKIEAGSYKQDFELSREGTGSSVGSVPA